MGRAGQGIILKKTKGTTRFMDLAACSEADIETFTEEPSARQRRLDNPRFITALGFCANCPVKALCLEWALDNHETGIWGGRYLDRGHVQVLR